MLAASSGDVAPACGGGASAAAAAASEATTQSAHAGGGPAEVPTAAHQHAPLSAASAAVELWLGGGDGREKLLGAFCSLESVCARCTAQLCGIKAPECYVVSEPELAGALRVSLARRSHAPPPAKRARLDTPAGETPPPDCAACTGILTGATPGLADSLAARVLDLGYAKTSIQFFMLSLSVPSSVIIRQHVYCTRVRTLLAETGTQELPGWKPLALKEAFQFALAPILSRLLDGARQEQTSAVQGCGRLCINVEYRHEESAGMKEVLLGAGNFKATVRAKARRGERRGQMQDIENTNAVSSNLAKITSERLFEKFPFPISPASSAPSMSVEIEREPVYVGGSYCKYSRQVSQSPWNAAHGDVGDSVQTLILKELSPLFQADEVKFVGSGREDLDVRMLGDGRPFFLEFINAKTLPLSPHLPLQDLGTPGSAVQAGGAGDDGSVVQAGGAGCDGLPGQVASAAELASAAGLASAADAARPGLWADIEVRVNASTDLVQVKQLRPAERGYVDHIKGACETKRKTYRSLVWTAQVPSVSDIERVNGITNLVLHQKTPVRVLHRRSLATRERTVANLRLRRINARFFLLDLETEAGTYVKEFVHGDMGRTLPSLAGLLQCDAADILQLDVVAVQH